MAMVRDRRIKPRSKGKAWRHHSVAILLAAFLGAASAQAPARQVEIAGTQRDVPDELVDSRSKIHTGDQLKCLNALSKGYMKVARAQDRDIYDCIKDRARGKSLVPATTAEECLTADRKRKVAKATRRAKSEAAQYCSLSLPDFTETDPNSVIQAAIQNQLDLIHKVFGPDLDATILRRSGPTTDGANCQQAVAQSVQRCQGAVLKEFSICKKNRLREGGIANVVALGGCMGPERNGRIARACDPTTGKIRSNIDKNCDGLDFPGVFPELALISGCTTNGSVSLATCLDRIVACQTCLALNQAEALDRDCDWFDDGVANASCRNPSLGPQDTAVIISTFASPFVDYPWPQDRANAERYFFDDTDSLDAYLWEASYGKTWLRGEVYGFYELPLPYSSYCPSPGICLWHMLKNNAIAAADPDIDFTRIDRVLLVFGGMPFQFARSTRGMERIRTQEGEITASVSWFDRATMGRSGARAHEMGHGFGARHAYGVSCGEHIINVDEEYFLAPKLPSTVLELSQQGYFFGDRCSVINGADDENSMGGDPDLLRHYSALQKERYGWLEREQVRVVDRTFPVTIVELEQYELPSDGIKAIKIPVFEGFQPGATPSAFFYYYLEYRREVGFDAGSKIEGVLVRLAMHPDYPSDFDSVTFLPEPFVLEPGIEFEDFYNENLTVELLAMSEDSATVEITYH